MGLSSGDSLAATLTSLSTQTGQVASDTFEAQARQAFANLRAVLEDAGSRLERVVKVTCFVSDAGGRRAARTSLLHRRDRGRPVGCLSSRRQLTLLRSERLRVVVRACEGAATRADPAHPLNERSAGDTI
jgi:hypothetical protein